MYFILVIFNFYLTYINKIFNILIYRISLIKAYKIGMYEHIKRYSKFTISLRILIFKKAFFNDLFIFNAKLAFCDHVI